MALLGGVRSADETDAYLERNLRHWDDFNFGVWILRDAASDEICGRGLLRHLMIDERDEVETGYGFHPAYWGRGLATEFTLNALRLGHDRLGLDTIVAITRPDHAASRRVMEKAAMRFDHEYQRDGVAAVVYRWTARQ